MNPIDAERADLYLHDLLTDTERTAFAQQLENDPELRAELDAARRRLALLESALPPAEADERLINFTLLRIEGNEKRRAKLRRRLWYAMLTPLVAAMLVIGVFHVRYNNLSA